MVPFGQGDIEDPLLAYGPKTEDFLREA